jgi:Protein of unknown function (DUF3341)
MSMPPPSALLAEFADARQLLEALVKVRTELPGMQLEVYSPYPIEAVAEILQVRGNRVPLSMLLGALGGSIGTYALQWYAAVIDYPLNVGGRPLNSWPAFVPAAIEMALLGAVLAGVLTMLIGSGLPRVHHPLFEIPSFERASNDRFFLLLRVTERSVQHSRSLLQTLEPVSLAEVGE